MLTIITCCNQNPQARALLHISYERGRELVDRNVTVWYNNHDKFASIYPSQRHILPPTWENIYRIFQVFPKFGIYEIYLYIIYIMKIIWQDHNFKYGRLIWLAKYFFEICSPLSLNMGHIWNHDFARLFVLLKIGFPVGTLWIHLFFSGNS